MGLLVHGVLLLHQDWLPGLVHAPDDSGRDQAVRHGEAQDRAVPHGLEGGLSPRVRIAGKGGTWAKLRSQLRYEGKSFEFQAAQRSPPPGLLVVGSACTESRR